MSWQTLTTWKFSLPIRKAQKFQPNFRNLNKYWSTIQIVSGSKVLAFAEDFDIAHSFNLDLEKHLYNNIPLRVIAKSLLLFYIN